MATTEQKTLIKESVEELMKALGKDPSLYFVDFGMDGCLIVGPDGVPPFGFVRRKPMEFWAGVEFATSVVEAGK